MKVLALVLGLCGATAQLAHATPFTFFNDFNKYGVQHNFACGGMGACGAVSTVNSFVFLEKQYPNIYDNNLTPNAVTDPMTMTVTDMTDAQNFGFDGWQVGSNPRRQGNYRRPGNVREQVYLDTKKDWINDYAPRTTVFDSWFPGSADNDRNPTINDLAEEIRKHEDVELWVKGPSEFHVIILTEVSCNMAMDCSIRYQDPNFPTINQPSTMVTIMDGMLQIPATPGFTGNVIITAAFSESPVPEPSTILLLATGFLGLLAATWRRSTEL